MDQARLRGIPAFAGLPDADLARIAALASEVSVPAGKVLVREGDWSYEIARARDTPRCPQATSRAPTAPGGGGVGVGCPP